MSDAAHARFSPSGASRWMNCPGSMVLEADYPDSPSRYAAEGSLAHLLASMSLEDQTSAHDHVGKSFTLDGFEFTVDKDMADYVMDYVALVGRYARDGHLLVERRVDFSPVIGQPDSFGTADAIVIHDGRMTVIDLKYGMGVKVDAENNPQLQIYALGALNDYGMLGDFDEITMVVHQPRLNHSDEWTIPVAQLEAFGEKVKEAADRVVEALVLATVRATDQEIADAGFLNPGEKSCKFCRAKANCPALRQEMAAFVDTAPASADEFKAFLEQAPEDTLADLMDKVPLVEMFVKGIRAETERRIFAGQPVRGYKLVEGKKGNRAWIDEDKVVEMLNKSFRFKLDDIFKSVLHSPAQIEKLLKGNPTRWKRIEALTSRAPGKPSVAPESDKRPALIPANIAEEFAGFVEEMAE